MSNVAVNERVLRGLRSYLRTLANRRINGVVTADDANNFLFRNGVQANRVRTRLSYLNRVLQGGSDFSPMGETSSKRPAARYRRITEWTL